MWFVKGKPNSVDIQALMVSIAGGYQETSFRFKIGAELEKVRVAIAIPWTAYKPNGSVQFLNASSNLLQLLEENSNNAVQPTLLGETNFSIYKRLRDLKAEQDIDLMQVQELCQWYLDDIGVVVCWVNVGEWYQLNYRHKIAADSCLFLPTRLPSVVSETKPSTNCKVWVINGIKADLPEHLVVTEYDRNLKNLLKESHTTLDCYVTKNGWKWDADTRIHTENWDSSDDEEGS